MSYDPSDYAPTGGYTIDEGICEFCHGVKEGYVGLPGEYPCRCGDGIYLDIEQERYQLRKKRCD
jgi:hypothetical protein